MSMHPTTVDYILKASAVGLPLDTIAKRLSISVEEVKQALEDNKEKSKAMVENGFSVYLEYFNDATSHYHLMGDALRNFAIVLDNRAEVEEVQKALGVPRELAQRIVSHFIVLRPIKKEDMPKLVMEAMEAVSRIKGN